MFDPTLTFISLIIVLAMVVFFLTKLYSRFDGLNLYVTHLTLKCRSLSDRVAALEKAKKPTSEEVQDQEEASGPGCRLPRN